MTALIPEAASPLIDSERQPQQVIPVMAEVAEIETLVEHTGTVRFRKVVHHDTQPVDGTGFQDVVDTQRMPVNQVVACAEPPYRRGGVLVIPVYEERWVRQLFLKEEVHITTRRERLSPDTTTVELRREELVKERFDPVTQRWTPDPS
ncbi:MAG: DUF2382 domain-containing protein [Pseudomonadota bacterium]